MFNNRGFKLAGLLSAFVVIFSMAAVDYAEARARGGGGFGSRGTRTFSQPAATQTAPAPASPINRSMTEIGVNNADLDKFEDMLTRVQMAYGREDYAALRELVTPEVMGFLAEEMGENASRGQVNRLADIKLLQGDVSESWTEGASEYATVAMRYQLRDWSVERNTDTVVSGNPDELEEATELWTFVRPRNADWKVSAIQQA